MASGMALPKQVLADFIMTLLWAMIVSTTGACLSLLSPLHQGEDTLKLLLLLSIALLQLLLFAALADAMGGASFNPLANIANFIAAVGDESVMGLLLRIPAQTAGMLLGAWLTWHMVVPESMRHTLGGPTLKPGVGVWAGAAVEFGLTFVLNALVLWVLFAGPASSATKALILLPATLAAIAAGAPFTGPSMNPLFAFTWAYHHNQHGSLDHFIVYWAAPLAGVIVAAILYRAFLQHRPLSKAVAGKASEKKTQ